MFLWLSQEGILAISQHAGKSEVEPFGMARSFLEKLERVVESDTHDESGTGRSAAHHLGSSPPLGDVPRRVAVLSFSAIGYALGLEYQHTGRHAGRRERSAARVAATLPSRRTRCLDCALRARLHRARQQGQDQNRLFENHSNAAVGA